MLPAIFAKVGVEDINPDFATFIRTISSCCRGLQPVRRGLLLPRAEAWACIAVAPVDKLSVVLVAIFGVIFLGERLKRTKLARCGVDCERCGACCAEVIRVTRLSACSSR